MFCLDEDFSYERWTSDPIDLCLSEFARWRQQHVSPASTDDFLRWLAARCDEVVAAQLTHPSPYPPRFLGNAEGTIPPDLLAVIAADTLAVALDDRWNSPTGLFRAAERAYLIGWWTSA
jgi:hypothetical protein